LLLQGGGEWLEGLLGLGLLLGWLLLLLLLLLLRSA
jgi:hypothetical protein